MSKQKRYAQPSQPRSERSDVSSASKPSANPAKPTAKGGKSGKGGRPATGGRSAKRKGRREDYIPREVLDKAALEHPELHQRILEVVLAEEYQAMKVEALARAVDPAMSAEEMTIFLRLLRKMELDYELVLSGKKTYIRPERAGIFRGEFLANPKGFGFVRTQQPDMPDVYIGRKHTNRAMHKDLVLIKMYGDYDHIDPNANFRPEGEVLKIVKRANEQIIGTFELDGRNAVVIPDERRLDFTVAIPFAEIGTAEPGDKVVVAVTTWGNRNLPPMGKIIRVLGAEGDKGVDMLSVIWQFCLPEEFNPAVVRAAEAVALPIEAADLVGRRDMRAQPLITIDGSDAKDLDDAVSCRRLPNGNFELSVHIADVAHYVRPGSVVDQEAFSRGTSVYLPDRVMPMLPPVLSNGMCSLNAGQDRLAMSCTMEINDRGRVVNSEVYESVIHVDKRFDYATVNRMLIDADPTALRENAEWAEMLELLAELQAVLEAKRVRRGAINFDLPETKVIVDMATGRVLDVVKRTSQLAEKLIEEAMIVTNETVATEFYRLKAPFVYRVHQGPGEEKLAALNTAILPLGLAVEGGSNGVKPRDMQKMLRQVAGTAQETFVQTLALRSMSHALYSPEATGHFGLASRYYSHFTSPIRRYADLTIHRVIKQVIHDGKPRGEAAKKLAKRISEAAEQSSITERQAELAEREAVDVKCCQFMQDKVGEIFDGHISGLNNGGIWVELENTIEGRIATADLPQDDYTFVQSLMTLRGHKHSYRLGDPMQIEVSRVNMAARELDFVMPGGRTERPSEQSGAGGSRPNGRKPQASAAKPNAKRRSGGKGRR